MKLLSFKSQSGVQYIYNDDTGLIFKSNPLLENMLMDSKEEIDALKKEYSSYEYDYYDRFTSKVKSLISQSRQSGNLEFSEADIEDYQDKYGFTELVFKMTGKCNLRCKYCFYSDHYSETVTYDDGEMTLDTGIKAIDIFMKHFIVGNKRYPEKQPIFAFYGGEPLMNNDVLVGLCNYITDNYSAYKPQFTITTNGLLLSKKEICDFLIEKNFWICISIDGNKEEHDRNRIDLNGEGSFDGIIRAIDENLKGYSDIYAIACYDFGTNFSNVEEFFKTHNIPMIRYSAINSEDTTYYDQFSEEERHTYFKRMNEIMVKYKEDASNNRPISGYINYLAGQTLFQVYDRGKFVKASGFFDHHTRTCIPGQKIYVDTDGSFHACEKINPNFEIGNVKEGVDYKKIKRIVKDYNHSVLSKCKTCTISRICNTCYVNASKDSDFIIKSDECNMKILSAKETLRNVVDIEEKNPVFFEKKFIKKTYDSQFKMTY